MYTFTLYRYQCVTTIYPCTIIHVLIKLCYPCTNLNWYHHNRALYYRGLNNNYVYDDIMYTFLLFPYMRVQVINIMSKFRVLITTEIVLQRNSCVAVLSVILRITPNPPNMWPEKNYAENNVSAFRIKNYFNTKTILEQ